MTLSASMRFLRPAKFFCLLAKKIICISTITVSDTSTKNGGAKKVFKPPGCHKFGALRLSFLTSDCERALTSVLVNGHHLCVSILIQHEVDINKICFGYTALMTAAEYGHKNVVETLIQRMPTSSHDRVRRRLDGPL